MEMQVHSFDAAHVFRSLPESLDSSPFCNKTSMEELLPENIYPSPAGTKTKVSKASLENTLIKAIIRDDKSKLIQEAKEIISSSDEPEQLDRAIMSNLLHLCCEFDSVNSAEALINGEINGVVPLTNEIDSSSGFAPLHTAAENHAQCCIELLIRKRARTDLKTKPKAAGNCNESGNCSARRLLPLELALRSSRVEVNWAPDQPLDDLLLLLSEKELGAIRVLAEKTKDTGEVAYTLAIEGRVAALTALLMVAADKVNGSVLEMRTNTDLAPEKTSVYNCVIREAVSILLRVRGKHNRVAQDNKDGGDDGAEERRKVLLKEMELLHFFGAANIGCLDKKATSPLIIVSQAGDEAVMKLLLQTGINVGDADAEGNSALHWCLKASKVSSPEHIRILCLLLKHGARVRQKDKLGLTAVHIAAGNGNLEALKILVSQDPESVFVTSELKETPLFFAAKNDFIECAQLLMTCGATTEVLNLRRERPIDLAKSQDMRSALNRTSVVITNRVSQQKYTTCMHSDQVISESCETLVKEPCSSSESGGSSGVDGEICKYFGSATGCARGSTCFYRHIEEDLSSSVSKLRAGSARSTVLAEFKLKIFVGGLPPTMDSDSLADAMKEQFGPVTEANVLKIEVDDQLMSRGFGFVTFKNEKSAAAALDAHYTNIWGKKVEMKSAVPKWLLPQEEHTDETQQEKVQQESTQYPTQVQTQHIPREDVLLEKMPWADRVGRQDDLVNEPKARRVKTVGQEVPVWLTTFKKWLPQFLRKMLRNSEGEYYSLSSLKSDFKSIFGLDLDHASLGYSKLSDFVKSMPELCRVKIVHTGGQVANHMILLPNTGRPPPLIVPPKGISVPRQPTPVSIPGDYASDCDHPPKGSDAKSGIASESNLDATSVKVNGKKESSLNPMVDVHLDYSRFSQFLEPDHVFLGRTWLGTGGFKVQDEQFRRKHLVLEALSRKRKQVFFLRDHKFYNDYTACLKEGSCFACEKKKMLWTNYPCQHLLWCGDCKFVAASIAVIGTSAHKCVVCDEVVEKIDLIPWTRRQHHKFEDREFPPVHDAYLRSPRLQL